MNSYGRYCDTCRYDHGYGYICESYSKELAEDIRTVNELYKTLEDGQAWWEKQKSIRPDIESMFKALMGV